jgi:hypothetical protein
MVLVDVTAAHIKITKRRWYVEIEIEGQEKLIISSDSVATYGDGIWVGTESEYNEIMES